MPGAHSSLGPSSAHRYRRCPGSVRASEGLPDTAGRDAAEGTVFHEFAALAAEFGASPLSMVGATFEVPPHGVIEFSQEMATKMLPGLDFIDAIHTPGVTQLFVETRVSLQPWLGKNQFGTMDIGVVNVPERRMTGLDWKWGAGVPVSPVENDQAQLYLLGLWESVARELFDNDPSGIEVDIVIEQPRAEGGGGLWTTTMEALLVEGEKIKADAARTRDPDAPRIPGVVQCKFCKAAKAGTCREYHEFNAALVAAKFDSLDDDYEPPSPIALTPEERSHILLNKSMILAWLDDLHAAAYRDAEAGRPVPGMKLVEGRTPARKWRDEAIAERVLVRRLGQKAHVSKLISPTQAEEVMGKRDFNRALGGYVAREKPKPVLVSSSHRKPGRATHGDKYDQLDTGEDGHSII